MDIFVLLSWRTLLHHRGWSVAECPFCQGLEPVRSEERVFTFSIYLLPLIQDSKGWIERCDFCERIVGTSSEAPSVTLDDWLPPQGLAALLRKLGHTGKVTVRRAPMDSKLESLLQATQEASSINSLGSALGLAIGSLVGILLSIPVGMLLFESLKIQAVDKFGFVFVACLVGALIGAVGGMIVQGMLRRQPFAKKKIGRACRDYQVDTNRLEELARNYNRIVHQAALAVRDEQGLRGR